MYTFHLEAAVPDWESAQHPVPDMEALCQEIKEAGMHVGVSVKPKTPERLLFPYLDKKLIDQVRQPTYGVFDAMVVVNLNAPSTHQYAVCQAQLSGSIVHVWWVFSSDAYVLNKQ